MIRSATSYDIPALKEIWDSCFSDPISYIDFVFDRLAKPTDAVIFEDGDKIVSMLLMIDATFVYREESVDVVYILGAATAAQYQNRGIMTYLLDHAENLARHKGVQLSVLVPGEQYLYNYYKKRGYSADFNVRLVKLKPGMLETTPQPENPVLIDRISPTFIHDVRESALAELPHICWNVEKIRTVMEDSFIYGDHIAAYSGTLGDSYIFYSVDRRKLFIKECLGSSDEAQLTLIKSIIRSSRAKSAQITLPLRSPLFEHEGQTVPFGMAKPLNIKSYLSDLEPYMNLMFD
ncbi:MAG: GNAT family N-acetyltransferase [Oscillospiraceae bacterium]|nr:GNAT family N-acetyltransferase [Oscillospiraceae bacterium]